MAYTVDPWKLIQTELDLEHIRLAESLTSTANGYMGMRGNFEEEFSGDSHVGTYIGGVWFPDKTRVGWWKNGYPAYFGKAINAVRMNGIRIRIDGETVDLAQIPYDSDVCELDMQTSVLRRSFTVRTRAGQRGDHRTAFPVRRAERADGDLPVGHARSRCRDRVRSLSGRERAQSGQPF